MNEVKLRGTQFETKESIKLLGLELSNEYWKYGYKWSKDWSRMEDLTDVFVKQVRSILEFGAPVRN